MSNFQYEKIDQIVGSEVENLSVSNASEFKKTSSSTPTIATTPTDSTSASNQGTQGNQTATTIGTDVNPSTSTTSTTSAPLPPCVNNSFSTPLFPIAVLYRDVVHDGKKPFSLLR